MAMPPFLYGEAMHGAATALACVVQTLDHLGSVNQRVRHATTATSACVLC